MKEEEIRKRLYKLSYRAYRRNEVPVSAILVRNNKIIAKGYNKKNINKNPLMHAEIICLNKAYKKLKRWNLCDCELYVTLEPCELCKMVIQESRINKVYYYLKQGSINNKYHKTKYEQMFEVVDSEFSELMRKFFKKIRKK